MKVLTECAEVRTFFSLGKKAPKDDMIESYKIMDTFLEEQSPSGVSSHDEHPDFKSRLHQNH